MTSTIHLFDWRGKPLAEIDAMTRRSWVTNNGIAGVGTCNFDVSTGDLKLYEQYLRSGVLVLIRHLYAPDWVGVIHTPQPIDYGSVEVNAYAAEKILEWRAAPMRTIDGTPGAIFTQLLDHANKINGTLIQPGEIYLGGHSTEEECSGQVYDHAVNIAQNSGMDWDVTYRLSERGELSLFGNWYASRGVDTGLLIDDSRIAIDSPLVRSGDIWNIVNGFGDASTDESRVRVLVSDDESADKYGPRSYNYTEGNVTNEGAVTKATEEFLRTHIAPADIFSPSVPEFQPDGTVNNLVPFLRIGNIFHSEKVVSYATQSGLDYSGRVRLDVVEYNDSSNRFDLGTEVIT